MYRFWLNLTHKREDIYRSIIEGISYGANHILETFTESGFKPKKLFAVGGGVKNNIWSSTISNISGFNQEVKKITVGAAYGNAFLAALAIGDVSKKDIIHWNTADYIIKSCPNPLYIKQFKLFKDLYKCTSKLLKK